MQEFRYNGRAIRRTTGAAQEVCNQGVVGSNPIRSISPSGGQADEHDDGARAHGRCLDRHLGLARERGPAERVHVGRGGGARLLLRLGRRCGGGGGEEIGRGAGGGRGERSGGGVFFKKKKKKV